MSRYERLIDGSNACAKETLTLTTKADQKQTLEETVASAKSTHTDLLIYHGSRGPLLIQIEL